MASESEKRAARRKRARERREASDWRKHPTAPTPYEEWRDAVVRSAYLADVRAALAKSPQPLAYRADRPAATLTLEEVALVLFAVARVGPKGLALGQIRRAFLVAGLRGFHRGKASAALRVLVAANLIRRTRGHSAGSHGACYERVRAEPSASDVDDWLKTLGRKGS